MTFRPPHRRPGDAAVPAGLSLRDGFDEPLATVAGFSARLAEDGGTVAGAVLLDAGTMEVLAQDVVRVPVPPPQDGEAAPADGLPALLAALEALPTAPGLALVDGHGIAHPRGAGLAARFGLATGLPCIGVAGEILAGSGPEPHQTRGAYTALRDAGRRQFGWLLRSRPGEPALVVSPAHRVALGSAADLVMRFTRGHRLPEPIRHARALVSGDSGAEQADHPGSPAKQ